MLITRLKLARIDAGLTAKAAAVTLGISYHHYVALEEGDAALSANELHAVEELYKKTADKLIGFAEVQNG